MERHPAKQSLPLVQSLTNKYYLAGTARTKLQYEADESDHNLLRLVGHANFLDRLQEDIESAEKLVETRKRQARVVRDFPPPRKGSIQWADITETVPDDEEAVSSDDEEAISDDENVPSQSEDDEEVLKLVRCPSRQHSHFHQGRSKAPTTKVKEVLIPGEALDEDSRQTRPPQLPLFLPRIVEEDESDEEDVERVTVLMEALNQPVVVGFA